MNPESKNACLGWLTRVDQSGLHAEILRKRTEGTGEWFLTGEFKDWKIRAQSFLWLHGRGKLQFRPPHDIPTNLTKLDVESRFSGILLAEAPTSKKANMS